MKNKVNNVNIPKKPQPKSVQLIKDLNLKTSDTEQKRINKAEVLIQIAKHKYLLDYASFGTATEAEMDDLKMISGIGPSIEERLHALDIYTYRQISKLSPHDIETINDAIEYLRGRIEKDEWVAQAQEIVINKDKWTDLLEQISEKKVDIYYTRIGLAKKEEADDLTMISGIGGRILKKLNALDIYTFKQIANFTEEDIQTITTALEYFPNRIEKDEWILQAKELVKIAGKKSELFERICEKEANIIFERIGIALKHHSNNLTLINGISLWMEERLNLLRIYTFEQISNLTQPDIETIIEILEISPECIDLDKWVAQSHKLIRTT